MADEINIPTTQLKIVEPSVDVTNVAEGADFQVEFEVIPTSVDFIDGVDAISSEIQKGIEEIEKRLVNNEEVLAKLDAEIGRLTNHADGIDYAVAVGCGLICGLIDSFFVGKFDFANAKRWSNKSINKYISDFAKKHGYKAKNGSKGKLKDKVAYLEEKFKSPTDSVWQSVDKGISTFTHHLDDWSHHPTPVGWICSIITQFTEVGYFANSEGEGMWFDADASRLVGGSIPEKVCAGTINWFGHLVSDMAGSSQTAGKGMGLPGPILSLARELAQLPGLNKTGLPKIISDAFSKEKFDLRKELAVAHELGRQAIPVVINEILVRLFYFIRRLVDEWRKNGFSGIDWKKTMPFKNRTIVRMMTIATGTFTAVDMADAAIRGAKGTGHPALFLTEFVLHVNFVGVGRFAIAVYSDLRMGFQLEHKHWEKIIAQNEKIQLLNAKIYYKQAGVWLQAEATEASIEQMVTSASTAWDKWLTAYNGIEQSLKMISGLSVGIEEHNPGLTLEIISQLEEP